MNKQQGFTLIELVVVIVVLGILAATALPRFVDLQTDARTSAIQGAAGALSSYSAINYAAALARSGGAGSTAAVWLGSATNAAGLLTASMGAWDTAKFSISVEANCSTAAAGSTKSATLLYATAAGGTSANSATATIVCTG